jgi:hypothetical protein|tara:strand:+ start:768 stop:1700 length:933 start_codon:yes stop_codon:yes gene_type:complete
MTLQYDIEQYEDIKNGGFAYDLSEDTITIVNQLAEQVGAPSYNKTPVFENKEYKKRKYNGNLTGEDWEAFRNFKATEIATSSGINKYFDDIRYSLNKMTENTYEQVKDEIVALLKNMMEEKYEDKAYNDIGKSIFDMASSNKFYSDIYAKLYSDIMKEFVMFKEIFASNLTQFMELFKNIEVADGDNEDYNRLCEINKQNDKRRALSLFFVNLMNYGVITEDSIIEIIDELQNKIIDCADKQGFTTSNEELSENIFIIVTNVKDRLHDHIVWTTIVNRIVNITEMSTTEKPSINNKIIFKHMDLMDILEG